MVLGPRDLELFKLFVTLRVATPAMLLPLVRRDFPTAGPFSRRLLALWDSRHVIRPPAQEALPHLTRGRPPDIYCLGNRGAKALRRAGLELPATDLDRKAEELSPFGLSHMLLTSDVVATFLMALETQPQLDLVRVLRDGELRVRVSYCDGHAQVLGSVQPDATLIVREDGTETALLLEIDRATMPGERTDALQSSFVKKCRCYLAWWQDAAKVRETLHVDDFLVLTVTTTPERAAALRDVAARADGGDVFWFTSREALTAETILAAPIWTTAAGSTGSLYGEDSAP